MDLLIVDSNGYSDTFKNISIIPRVGDKIWFRDSYYVTVNEVAFNYNENRVTITVEW